MKGSAMSLLDKLTGWIDRDAEQLAYVRVEPSRVDRPGEARAAEAGAHYFRLRLASMFLKKQTRWFKEWRPAVHSTVRLSFGDRQVEIPTISDLTRVGMLETAGGDIIARNYMLTPTLPFGGGVVSLSAGLLALDAGNHLEGFLKTLGGFAGLLGAAQFASVLNIVQPLSQGIQDLFAAGGRVHLGLHDSFAAGELRDGYFAAVRTPARGVAAGRLWVIGDALHEGATIEEARQRPLEQYDHMLFRMEVFDRRDDWEQLTSIQEPFQSALAALHDPQTAPQAAQHMRTALLRAVKSPELTAVDKRRVVERLKEQYEAAKTAFAFDGAFGEEPPTLKRVMRAPMPLRQAQDLGEPTVEEVFGIVPPAEIKPAKKKSAKSGDARPRKGAAASAEPPAPGDAMSKGLEKGLDETFEALPADAKEPTFNFELRGEKAKGAEVVYGSDFHLVFNYGAATPEVLASVRGRILEEKLKEGDFDLDITVVPRGFNFTDGGYSKTARFRGGRLEGDVVFNLRAASGPVEESGLYVIFEVKGNIIYEFHLPVRLVAALGQTPAADVPPLDLDLDDIAAARGREPRAARLHIFADGDRLDVNYDDLNNEVSFPVFPRLVTRGFLSDALPALKDSLEPVPEHQVWRLLDDPLGAAATGKAAAALRECTERVVTAGWALYSQLSADEEFRKVLDEVFGLAPGSRLSIRTDCAFIPWEILYPEEYSFEWSEELKAQQPMQPQKLLGNLLRIECLLAGRGKSYKSQTAAHESSPPYVSFNLFRTIDDGYEESAFRPGASHEELSGRLEAAGVQTEVWKSGDDIRHNVIEKDSHRATLLYFLCHGQNDRPIHPQQREKLEIDEEQFVAPLNVPRGLLFPSGPLVFLNSCNSGSFSPLAFSTFLSVFREKQAVGLLATSFPVPIRFAAAFGQEIISRYAKGAESVGDALFDLRRSLLARGNPLGLFYTLQCPMDIKARPPEETR